VIEVAGIRFLVEKDLLRLVIGLRVDVAQSLGRKVLVASHPYFDPGGTC
jgi:hypothetical protein